MALYSDIIFFLLGFFLLIKGASILVDGASSIAKLWKMSPWIIGVIIVGIGTSLPELSINVASVFSGTSLGLGTIIGSNTFNILAILGAIAIVSPVYVERSWIWKDFTANIFAVALIVFFFFSGFEGSTITRGEGFLIFLTFFAWIWYTLKRPQDIKGEQRGTAAFTYSISLLLIGVGIIGVFLGGRWVVEGASKIAAFFGASDSLVGLTIVGVGTSLPELVVSLAAAWKGKAALAIGNVIGSNIFDFLGIMGLVAIMKPVELPADLNFPLIITLLVSIALFASMFIGRKYTLSRKEGMLFLAAYAAYAIFLIR